MSGTEQITASRKTAGRPRGYIADYRPQTKTLALLDAVQQVLHEYRAHWPLTIRQVFYRLIGAHGYDKSETFYGTLCHHMANARRARVIPFYAIRDDGVTLVDMKHFDDSDDFRRHVRKLSERYRRNLLATQPIHVEVWCEAAGMIFQLADVAEDYSIHVRSSGGFDSLTAKKDLADRICDIGKPAVILHLGDHDPSGAAMFDVVAQDVAAFVAADRLYAGVNVQFQRVALTAPQVSAFDLPTAPAKTTDSRSKAWSGETCQLEALAPDQIADLLRAAIEDVLDLDQVDEDRTVERVEKQELTRLLAAPTGAA